MSERDHESGEEPTELRLLAGKPTRWPQRLWLAATLAALTAARLSFGDAGPSMLAWITTLAAAVSATATWWLGRPRERRAVIERDQVGIDGIGWVARRDVREVAHERTRSGRTLMVLRDARGDVLASIEASDAASGEVLLHRLGLRFDDVVRREGRGSASRGELLAMLATMAGYVVLLDGLVDRPGVSWPSISSLVLVVAGAAIRRQVVVGLDSVVLERATRREVYPYARIARVDRTRATGPALILDDGRVVELVGSRMGTDPGTVWIVGWIERGLERWRRREAQHVPAGLAPGDGDVEAWKRQLDGITQQRDYRSAQVPPAALVRVAADPSASAEERVGAARVLCRVQLDDAQRETLERAALATAEPMVREALEASTRADLDATERALRAVRNRG